MTLAEINTLGIVAMPDPEIGMGVTEYPHYGPESSARTPHTVVRIISATSVAVQQDRGIRLDDGDGHGQVYRYERLRSAPENILTKRRNGWWIPAGETMRHGRRFALGMREFYRDPLL